MGGQMGGWWMDRRWTNGGTDLTADLAQVARPTKTPTVSQWLSPLPGKREHPSCPEASLQQPRLQRLVVIWVRHSISNHFSNSWLSPSDPLPSTFFLGFFNPGEMLSECFQFVYAQLIKMPFCKSRLNSERPGKHPPVYLYVKGT